MDEEQFNKAKSLVFEINMVRRTVELLSQAESISDILHLIQDGGTFDMESFVIKFKEEGLPEQKAKLAVLEKQFRDI